MRMRFLGARAAVCLLGLTLLACAPVYAQRGGGGGGGMPPGGGGMGGPGGGGGGGFPGGMGGHGGDGTQTRGQQGGLGQTQTRAGGQSAGLGGPGGLQMGPAGRWWDDRHYVRALKIRPDQQKRMDAVFENNRGLLQQSLMSLKQEQMRLLVLEQTPKTDEAALFAQIDRVSAARTTLEKADAHVRLELRKEMDADQIAQLEKSQ